MFMIVSLLRDYTLLLVTLIRKVTLYIVYRLDYSIELSIYSVDNIIDPRQN